MRGIAHQGIELAAFDRLLLLRAVLCSPDRERLAAVLGQSAAAEYRACIHALNEQGVDRALASVLLELAEQTYGRESVPSFEPGPLRELYSWHDLDSFLIDLHGWLEQAAGPALSHLIDQRTQRGALSEATERAVREILCHAPTRPARPD